MNKHIQARLNMNYTLRLILREHKTLISKLPALTKMVEELDQNVKEMEQAIMVVTASTKGITELKKNARLELAALTAGCSGILKSWATGNDLFELKKKMSISPSLLRVMGAGNLLNYARLVMQQLKENQPSLTEYEVTATLIEEYDTAINALAAAIAAPKQAMSAKKAMKERLHTLVKANRVLINERITPVILLLKLKEPAFYMAFRECCNIRAPYTRHTRAEGVITDQQTGEGLAGVVVKSTDTDHTTTTDRNGKYKLYLPGKGSYAIVFQKPGYQVHEQKELSLCTGEATALSVALTATG